MDSKSVKQITDECEKAINRIIKNLIPTETCPVKKAKADWKKEKVVTELIVRLNSAGPSVIK